MSVVESIQPPTIHLYDSSSSSVTLLLIKPPCHADVCGHIATYTVYYCLVHLRDNQCLGMLTAVPSCSLVVVVDLQGSYSDDDDGSGSTRLQI